MGPPAPRFGAPPDGYTLLTDPGSTPEAFAATMQRDLVKWTKVVKDSGARLE